MNKGVPATDLVEKLRPFVVKVVEAEALELVDIKFGRRALVVVIDREGGIRVSDCEGVSAHLSTVLDVEDLIPFPYSLEVTSPGLDRPLRTARDFERVKGRMVRLLLSQPDAGALSLLGRLLDVAQDRVTIEPVTPGRRGRPSSSGEPVEIPLERIVEAKQEVVFKR